MSAAEYQDEYTRDAFINGLRNSYIRQRLLERPNLDLKEAFKIARSLELAEEQSNAYSSSDLRFSASAAISDTNYSRKINFDGDDTTRTFFDCFDNFTLEINSAQSTSKMLLVWRCAPQLTLLSCKKRQLPQMQFSWSLGQSMSRWSTITSFETREGYVCYYQRLSASLWYNMRCSILSFPFSRNNRSRRNGIGSLD